MNTSYIHSWCGVPSRLERKICLVNPLFFADMLNKAFLKPLSTYIPYHQSAVFR